MELATKTINRQAADHEAIVNDAPREFTEADFPVGTVAHQGDLILVRIETLPEVIRPRTNRQMAEGETQGSRHVLKTGIAYDCRPDDAARAIAEATGTAVDPRYCGPVFITEKGRAELVHPEHGDHHYRGEMAIAVVHQRNLDAELREQRVQD